MFRTSSHHWARLYRPIPAVNSHGALQVSALPFEYSHGSLYSGMQLSLQPSHTSRSRLQSGLAAHSAMHCASGVQDAAPKLRMQSVHQLLHSPQ